MGKLSNLKPERVFYYFEELTKIPRCSGQEKQVSDYLKTIGENLGLETIQDDSLNIIIKKPGTKGYEDKPIVIIQGHMDMVCEKNDVCDFDFSKDPINIEIDGDWVVARETTLGGDNGIAVAISLAILESEDIPHPPLEILITTEEEVGLTGAIELDPKNIDGKILINIDSEEEGTILTSSAGGQKTLVTIDIDWKESNRELFELKVSGLKGGHSGIEINTGKGNSNVILGRVLNKLRKDVEFDIANIYGGSKSNAIPRLSIANITLDESSLHKVEEIIKSLENEIKNELISTDAGIRISLEKKGKAEMVFDEKAKNAAIDALILIPNGVQTMSQNIDGLVECSNNIGVLKTVEEVTIECSTRSSIRTLIDFNADRTEAIARIIGAKFTKFAAYPGWEYNQNSVIRDLFAETYSELFGKDANVTAIHAGLECGLFGEKLGNMDMVSIGPNMIGLHAPGEKFSISSVARTWELVLKVLEKIN